MKTIRKTVGEYVAEDYRTAAVFQKYGIDFCCTGSKTIDEACSDKKINQDNLLKDLIIVKSKLNNEKDNYPSWPLDMLVEYIENKHHSYVEKTVPTIKKYLEKICTIHGGNHPELFEIREEFVAAADELEEQMEEEELILFPHIQKIVKTDHVISGQNSIHTVKNFIPVMLQEHDSEGERFKKISELSHDYSIPFDACNTYRTTFTMLKEFADNLHQHVHLENNILFPKSLDLETSLSQHATNSRSYDTVSEAIRDLAKRGYTADFSLLMNKGKCLICDAAPEELSAEEFNIDETYRFEGNTDPGDEMIVYAISSQKYDLKGIVVNAFGIYSDTETSKIVRNLIHHV